MNLYLIVLLLLAAGAVLEWFKPISKRYLLSAGV